MRDIVLPGTDLATSRLGFGTAALMARLGRRESVRLLEVAHDAGIDHLDTARSYGYGEAEAAVGQFLAGRRDRVTVTTKVGMLPPRRSRGLAAAKSLARAAVARAPALRPLVRRPAKSLVRSGRFAPAEARSSLETSLRELRTDHVDILLLHECRPPDLETDGLLEFLEAVVREGKVRAFGIGTDTESTRTILAELGRFAPVVQVAADAVEGTLGALPGLAGRAVITHSAVRATVGPLAALMGDAALRDRWSRETGADCGREDVLGRLLLAAALQANPGGVVLFSSTDEARIRADASLAAGGAFPPEQVRAFVRLARAARVSAG